MKKNNFLPMLRVTLALLLTVVGTTGWAQKTVKYTFTGRNGTYIFGLNKKALGLYVSGGTAPKGVSVGTIFGITYEETEKENINDVGIGNTVGVPFIPQYLVMPEDEAVINFKNFAYEIKDIYWTSRSQVPLLTSKTSTWVTKWDGTNTSTEITDWTNSDAESKANSSSWQLFYHKKLFTKDENYSGIKSLHVTCDSKQALHGHSMKDFIISYYEPEITITAPDGLDLEGGTTTSGEFSATIGAHAGAFKDAMITVTATKPDGTTVTLNSDNRSGSITSGSTVGAVVLTATLTFEGTVIATATKKVQIGQFDFDFVQKELRCDYGTGTFGYGDASSVHAYYSYYSPTIDDRSGLRLFDEAQNDNSANEEKYWWASADDYLDYSNSASGKITNIYNPITDNNNYYKVCLQRIDYNQFVPAYSEVSVPITFNMAGTRTSNHKSTSSGFAVAMYDFGQGSEQIWPDKQSNDNYQYFSLGNVEKDDYTGDANLIGSFGYSTSLGIAIGNSIMDLDYAADVSQDVEAKFKFTNTDNATGYVDSKMTEQLGAYSFVKNSSLTYRSWMNSTFDYSGRSKTIEYYRYINYDGNGNDDETSTETTTGTCLSAETGYKTATVAVSANGFTKADDASNTYQFTGWNTAADGTGTSYLPGDGMNIYNSTGNCGAGPITLYAQWKAIPITTRVANGDDNVYSLWGNGGTIDGKEIVGAPFVLGGDVSSVTPAVYNGYTFLGYYDDPEDGTQIFDATGAPVGDGTIITYGKKWAAEHDVYLYAHWERNASVTLKSITITLNANEGTLADASSITCTQGSSENNNIATQTPTRAGYKFAGWYTTTDNSGLMVYNANGESVTLESYSVDSEGNITPVYTVLNPTFFNVNGKYVGSAAPFNEDFTIYAHWIANNAALAFDEYVTDPKASSWNYNDGSASGYFSSTPTYEVAEYPTVTITRTLKKEGWNTVCFPFDISKKQVTALFSDVEMFDSLTLKGTTATMGFAKCDVMMAGVPYFVKLNSTLPSSGIAYVSKSDDNNVTELTFKDVTNNKVPTTISITKDNTTVEMIGEYNTHIGIPDKALFLNGGKFYVSGGVYNGKKVTGNNKGFRCYFTNVTTTATAGGAKSYNFLDTSIDLEGYDGYTDVDEIGIDPDHCTFSIAPVEIYDLSGRKLSDKPEKGVYIMNGKKYIAQ